jgi:hypothetical protein
VYFNKEEEMVRRCFVFIVFFLLLSPLLLHSERPYVGLEGDVFFPKGDWSENLDTKFCYKLSLNQHLLYFFHASLSFGGMSITRKFEPDITLSMFPILYFDLIAQKRIGKSPLILGLFAGYNFASQKITYDLGEESGSVSGWSAGGLVSLKFDFIIKPYVKGRYISRKDTGGIELCAGIHI